MIMSFETDDEILYVPTAMPAEVPTYDDSYESEYETNWQDWEDDMEEYLEDFDKLSIYVPRRRRRRRENECWITVQDDDVALNYWIVGYETQYGLSTENDDEVFGAIVDMNFSDVPSWGIEETNPVFAIGDDELYFAPADSSTFERGSINETDPYDIL